MEDTAVELVTHMRAASGARALSVQCPQCGLVEEDDYEIVSSDSATSWRCSECANCFDVVAVDCESCWTASYAQVLSTSMPTQPQALTCRHCGGGLFADLAATDEGESDEQWH